MKNSKKGIKKVISFLTIFIAVFVSLLALKVVAKTEVSEVRISSDGDQVFKLGYYIDPLNFTFAEDNGITQRTNYWERKNGSDEWETVQSDEFTPGTYRYTAQLVIDGTDANNYAFANDVNVYVDDVQWTTDTPVVNETSSYVWITSGELVIENQIYTITVDPNGGTPTTNFKSTIELDYEEYYAFDYYDGEEVLVTPPAGKAFAGYELTMPDGGVEKLRNVEISGSDYYDGAVVKYLWGDILNEIDLKFISPTDGSSTTTPKINDDGFEYWNWNKQTNNPKYYSNHNDIYVISGTYWTDNTSSIYEDAPISSYEDPYIGKLNAGSTYTTELYLYTVSYDYVLGNSEDIVVKINGKIVNAEVYSEGNYAVIVYEMKIDNAYKPPFSDVKTNGWYFDSVMAAYEAGIIKGYDNGKFGVNDKITRGQLAVILYRLEESPNVSSLSNPFDDVDEGKYYTDAVKWAYANHIVNGYSNGNFGPNDNIKRKDFAVMLHNYADALGLYIDVDSDLTELADYDKVQGNYSEAALQWAYGVGVISGAEKDGKRYLNPNNNAIRAEAAAMIINFISAYTYAEIY